MEAVLVPLMALAVVSLVGHAIWVAVSAVFRLAVHAFGAVDRWQRIVDTVDQK
ncbi:hypothetical protein [Tautonia sociabilis]|uniref:hypothetical protein n=1 Tax=Tautonia sociabilis TaxID=2080755 RepID=UPI00131520A3|nr:hypothetical protein [Tautonia sociabilis]